MQTLPLKIWLPFWSVMRGTIEKTGLMVHSCFLAWVDVNIFMADLTMILSYLKKR